MRVYSSALLGSKTFAELLPRHRSSEEQVRLLLYTSDATGHRYNLSTADATQIRIMSMITASIWVPRGAAANFPTRYDIDESELSRISKLAKLQLEDANEDLDNARNGGDNTSSMEESEDDQIGTKLPKSQE